MGFSEDTDGKCLRDANYLYFMKVLNEINRMLSGRERTKKAMKGHVGFNRPATKLQEELWES
jgi:hypothetical protein